MLLDYAAKSQITFSDRVFMSEVIVLALNVGIDVNNEGQKRLLFTSILHPETTSCISTETWKYVMLNNPMCALAFQQVTKKEARLYSYGLP